MAGDSRLSPQLPTALAIATKVATFLGPLLRIMDPSTINPPEVPAKAIAELVGSNSTEISGRHYILDKVSQDTKYSLNTTVQDEVLKTMISDLGKWDQ
jgi:hypothetical protein